jgi:hypothetical protein
MNRRRSIEKHALRRATERYDSFFSELSIQKIKNNIKNGKDTILIRHISVARTMYFVLTENHSNDGEYLRIYAVGYNHEYDELVTFLPETEIENYFDLIPENWKRYIPPGIKHKQNNVKFDLNEAIKDALLDIWNHNRIIKLEKDLYVVFCEGKIYTVKTHENDILSIEQDDSIALNYPFLFNEMWHRFFTPEITQQIKQIYDAFNNFKFIDEIISTDRHNYYLPNELIKINNTQRIELRELIKNYYTNSKFIFNLYGNNVKVFLFPEHKVIAIDYDKRIVYPLAPYIIYNYIDCMSSCQLDGELKMLYDNAKSSGSLINFLTDEINKTWKTLGYYKKIDDYHIAIKRKIPFIIKDDKLCSLSENIDKLSQLPENIKTQFTGSLLYKIREFEVRNEI